MKPLLHSKKPLGFLNRFFTWLDGAPLWLAGFPLIRIADQHQVGGKPEKDDESVCRRRMPPFGQQQEGIELSSPCIACSHP